MTSRWRSWGTRPSNAFRVVSFSSALMPLKAWSLHFAQETSMGACTPHSLSSLPRSTSVSWSAQGAPWGLKPCVVGLSISARPAAYIISEVATLAGIVLIVLGLVFFGGAFAHTLRDVLKAPI